MARKNYTEEQKAAALAKVAEIGVTKASKELSISVNTLNAWKKAADTAGALAKKAVSAKTGPLSPAKQEKLIAENAVLKADIAQLKEENARLKKAIADLTK